MTIQYKVTAHNHEVIKISDGSDCVYLDKAEVKEAIHYLEYYLEHGVFPPDWSFVNKSHCDCYEVTERVGVNVEPFTEKEIKFYFTIEDVVYILNHYTDSCGKNITKLEDEDGELFYHTILGTDNSAEYKPLFDRLVEVSKEVYSY